MVIAKRKKKAIGGHVGDYRPIDIDSIKFWFKIGLLRWADWSRFKLVTDEQYDKVQGANVFTEKKWFSRPNSIRGFGRIVIDELRGQVELSFSSKLLGCDPREFINKNNFVEVLEIVNRLGFIHFDTLEASKSGWVSNLDVTKMTQFGSADAARNAIKLTHIMSHAKDWNHKKHKHTKGGADSEFKQEGVLWKSYYKLAQIALKTVGKGDIPAYEFVVNNSLENEFAGYMRTEITLRSQKKVREYLGIKD
ncbi:MAG: hypothetical protein ACW98F_20700 [Candidatus Hodarchaeales archaeon]|jgi:hypothetical protein